MSQNKSTLIYVGDPMCSWCYGFSNELSKTIQHFENKLDIELVLGGLRPYNTETMVDLKDFLTHHWEEVHQASGQAFKYDILNESSIAYDTEPPSRAVVIIRNCNPNLEMAFFQKTQEAFYFENKNMHLAESYRAILEELDINFDTFEKSFKSDEMKSLVRKDFEKANEIGVRSFPTLVLKHNGKQTIIAQGYAKSEAIITSIEKLLLE